jgi:hypothetical protein
VSRTTILVLVALGAALAGFAFSTTAKRLQSEEASADASAAARPQLAALGWRESYGSATERLVFSVRSLEVVRDGWRARLSLENGTSVSYEVGDPREALDRAFGVMLFSKGDLETLEDLNADGKLPAVRPATRYEPRLPRVLEPGASWTGTISAPGALVAGSWVRVAFGALTSVGQPPDPLAERVAWITDRAYRLHP